MSHIVNSATRTAANLKGLKGLRFGHLFVVRRTEGSRLEYISSTFWQCLCDCGESVDVAGRRLRGGRVTACGKTSCRYPARAVDAPKWVEPKAEQAIIKRLPVQRQNLTSLTSEQRRAMVNGFLTSGFTRAEAEEMAGMGTVLIKEEVAA